MRGVRRLTAQPAHGPYRSGRRELAARAVAWLACSAAQRCYDVTEEVGRRVRRSFEIPICREKSDVSETVAEGITNPPIDELLERTQSKYALVIIAAKRARQINAYYSQLGEGLLEYVGPLVETAPQEKPLSIALREINSDLIEFKPSDPAPVPGAAPTEE